MKEKAGELPVLLDFVGLPEFWSEEIAQQGRRIWYPGKGADELDWLRRMRASWHDSSEVRVVMNWGDPQAVAVISEIKAVRDNGYVQTFWRLGQRYFGNRGVCQLSISGGGDPAAIAKLRGAADWWLTFNRSDRRSASSRFIVIDAAGLNPAVLEVIDFSLALASNQDHEVINVSHQKRGTREDFRRLFQGLDLHLVEPERRENPPLRLVMILPSEQAMAGNLLEALIERGVPQQSLRLIKQVSPERIEPIRLLNG